MINIVTITFGAYLKKKKKKQLLNISMEWNKKKGIEELLNQKYMQHKTPFLLKVAL